MKRGEQQNNLYFIEARWFNTVGFVLAQEAHSREYVCYTYKCGGDNNYISTEDQDIKKILAHGSTFPLAAAAELFHYDMTKDWISDNPQYFL